MTIEDDCSPSTSGRNEFSTSSTSPKCGKPQTNVMVSSDRLCNIDSELIVDDLLSLSYCNASSLDLNTHNTINVIHASFDSPCISSKISWINLLMICLLYLVAMIKMLVFPLTLV